MDYHTATNQLRTTNIQSIKTESPTVKTFTLKDKQCAKASPGQFLMLWIPGVDEIPFSILDAHKDGTVAVAVRKVGEATKALHNMKIGETVGVRGPFGNHFTKKGGKVLIVGGGTGIAPLLFLAKRLKPIAKRLTFVAGAKEQKELLLMDEIERLCGKTNVIATTEDGSYGLKCLATEPLEKLLSKEKFDIIYTCGPEQMMMKIFELVEKHEATVEASLERLMRCAIGLCGSCVVGKYRVCRDGPVFKNKQLGEIKAEFGKSKRDFYGRKTRL